MHIATHAHDGRIFARALSRPTFAALARGQSSKLTLNFVRASTPLNQFKTVRALFEAAYSALQSNFRNEYVYKSAIANQIVFGLHSPETSSLHIELPVGRSIADVAVFNGVATAYEIKTEFDTPRRLVTQTPNYLRAFEQVYVVTHPKFVSKYMENCDPRVGVYSLLADETLQLEREATHNSNLDRRLLFRMLRRGEYVRALEAIFGKISLPNTQISCVCEQMFLSLPETQAREIFMGAMRSRTTDFDTVDFVRSLPVYLRVLGYSTPLSRPQRANILNLLSKPIR